MMNIRLCQFRVNLDPATTAAVLYCPGRSPRTSPVGKLLKVLNNKNGLFFSGLRVALRSHPGHTCSVWTAP